MSIDEVEVIYEKRLAVLQLLASAIEGQLRDYLAGEPRIDRVQARAKALERFTKKARKNVGGVLKYASPLEQIQDQVGARIITFYKSDVEKVSLIVERYFRHVERRILIPESESEFGYEGKHYVLLVPKDLIDPDWDVELLPDFFELQIKTLFQHAWSEASHDLGYKPELRPLEIEERRRLAFTAAQAWGADEIFQELYEKLLGGEHPGQISL